MALESAPSGGSPLPCPDWVFVSGSNVHVAKDRLWFADDYTPFRSVLGDGTPVEGIGSAKLPVKRSLSSSGANGHTTLHLATVLHAPRATCNILGLPLVDEYKLDTNFQDPSKSSIQDRQGRPLAFFRPVSRTCQLLALRLSGPPIGPKVGPSPLGHLDTSLVVIRFNAVWPETERQRWSSSRLLSASSTSGNVAKDSSGESSAPPLAASQFAPGPKRIHLPPQNAQPVSASKLPPAGSSSSASSSLRRSAVAPPLPPQEEEDNKGEERDTPALALVERLDEQLVRVVSVGKETRRSCFMFPDLHEDVRAAISEQMLPSIWFNADADDDDDEDDYHTSIMGKFKCGNKKCRNHSWSSRKIAIWIREYPNDGYNAVVFNQRCQSCDELGKMTLNKETYVDRVSYRLRKWAGLPVEQQQFSEESKGPHDSEHCEGCRMGHCGLMGQFDTRSYSS